MVDILKESMDLFTCCLVELSCNKAGWHALKVPRQLRRAVRRPSTAGGSGSGSGGVRGEAAMRRRDSPCKKRCESDFSFSSCNFCRFVFYYPFFFHVNLFLYYLIPRLSSRNGPSGTRGSETLWGTTEAAGIAGRQPGTYLVDRRGELTGRYSGMVKNHAGMMLAFIMVEICLLKKNRNISRWSRPIL